MVAVLGGGVRADRPDKLTRNQIDAAHATADIVCTSCHAIVHVRDGKPAYGEAQCRVCHHRESLPRLQPRRMPDFAEAHDSAGRFPLRAGHQAVPCVDCHVARNANHDPVFSRLRAECSACHQDVHAGARGLTCATCHVTASWEMKSEHPVSTVRPELPPFRRCAACHADPRRASP